MDRFLDVNIHCFLEDLYDSEKEGELHHDNGKNNPTNIDLIDWINKESENENYGNGFDFDHNNNNKVENGLRSNAS